MGGFLKSKVFKPRRIEKFILKEKEFLKNRMKIYEELGTLKVDNEVELELKSYYSDRDTPRIISATGLGGSAGTCSFIDYLARDFHIVTFSPRNSGFSNGYLTVENYVSDTARLVDYLSQKNRRKPFGIGHSAGGYAIARLLGEGSLVEKAVLLAPLLQMSEQNPLLLNNYLRWCIQASRQPIPRFLLKQGKEPQRRYFVFGKQRFDLEHISAFLNSLYESPPCNKKLLSSTKVILAGGTCFRLPIPNKRLRQLERIWRNLGADVETHQDMNHWFSGSRWFSGVGVPFIHFEEKNILYSMEDFLKR